MELLASSTRGNREADRLGRLSSSPEEPLSLSYLLALPRTLQIKTHPRLPLPKRKPHLLPQALSLLTQPARGLPGRTHSLWLDTCEVKLYSPSDSGHAALCHWAFISLPLHGKGSSRGRGTPRKVPPKVMGYSEERPVNSPSQGQHGRP